MTYDRTERTVTRTQVNSHAQEYLQRDFERLESRCTMNKRECDCGWEFQNDDDDDDDADAEQNRIQYRIERW